MEVRDPVHGSIQILDEEIPILEHSFFQRLRNIKQLGFSEYVFPGATHTRLLHSIGVMELSGQVFDRLFQHQKKNSDLKRLKECLRLACLLHDIGHAPLSHSTESVMPQLKELNLPKSLIDGNHNRQATHEDYTLKAIVESSFTTSFDKVRSTFGVTPEAIAELILGKTNNPDFFTLNGVNTFPILHQLVSSEVDCDRMDYLLRDSYFCGVSYGKFDLPWLIDNLSVATIDKTAYLGISERAIPTFDDFLLSRFHMFIMVYFHYRAVCMEQMLLKYFQSERGEYQIPANIEEYAKHDDHFLMNTLRLSKNDWAKRIVSNNIPQKILETFGDKSGQIEKLNNVEKLLTENKIDYIKCSSQGRLSKYYTEGMPQKSIPIWVISSNLPLSENTNVTNINEVTELYERYSTTHAVNRLHCDLEDINPKLKAEIKTILDGKKE